MARLRTSDQQAVEELFNACYPRLAGWVRRLVDDDETAHEIASEAFTRLLSRWSGLDNPQSYLYMIATNLVRDHWRKTGRERNAIRVMTAAGPADPAYHPAQDVDVRALIQALPERLRSPFLLHYYGGFGLKEVAVMLGRPEGTIKADLFNARARLRAALGDAVTSPRDEIDEWLGGEVRPLYPPPGSLDQIRHRARRRKTRQAVFAAAGCAVVLAAAVTVPQLVGGGHRPAAAHPPVAAGSTRSSVPAERQPERGDQHRRACGRVAARCCRSAVTCRRRRREHLRRRISGPRR